MALIHCEFYSDILKEEVGAYVVIPEHRDIKGKRKLKTLYLLHGLGDDHTKWVRRTPIERYAKEGDWIVIMPEGEKGYYTNNVQGKRYWDYIGEELPGLMKSYFPLISDKREDNYVAGLSMGGFGSMKLALNFPERFCAGASFSGALDIRMEYNDYPQYTELYKKVFGPVEKILDSENDLSTVLRKLKENKRQIPRLYISCGLQDDIYPQSQEFIKQLRSLEIPYTYEEWNGGHDWIFWDESIRRALSWFLTCGTKENE